MAAIACVAGVTLPAIANLKLIPSETRVDPVVPANRSPETIDKQGSNAAYLEAFAWAARAKLEDLSLHHSVVISITEDDALKATGKITNGLAPRYDVFKNWYRSRKNFPDFLDEVEFLQSSGLLPKLKSVWFGARETAYFDDGSSGVVGSIIGDSWEIVSIDQKSVKLTRDGATIAINY